MERYIRLLMLVIGMMFGIIPIAQAQDIPFEFHAPHFQFCNHLSTSQTFHPMLSSSYNLTTPQASNLESLKPNRLSLFWTLFY